MSPLISLASPVDGAMCTLYQPSNMVHHNSPAFSTALLSTTVSDGNEDDAVAFFLLLIPPPPPPPLLPTLAEGTVILEDAGNTPGAERSCTERGTGRGTGTGGTATGAGTGTGTENLVACCGNSGVASGKEDKWGGGIGGGPGGGGGGQT